MRLVESSNTEVSGASEVSQSHGKLFFRKSSSGDNKYYGVSHASGLRSDLGLNTSVA